MKRSKNTEHKITSKKWLERPQLNRNKTKLCVSVLVLCGLTWFRYISKSIFKYCYYKMVDFRSPIYSRSHTNAESAGTYTHARTSICDHEVNQKGNFNRNRLRSYKMCCFFYDYFIWVWLSAWWSVLHQKNRRQKTRATRATEKKHVGRRETRKSVRRRDKRKVHCPSPCR